MSRFCVAILEESLAKYGKPDIVNAERGEQSLSFLTKTPYAAKLFAYPLQDKDRLRKYCLRRLGADLMDCPVDAGEGAKDRRANTTHDRRPVNGT